MNFNRELYFEIEGNCIVKKNQYKYTRKGGKSWGYKPKNVVDFNESAILQIKTQLSKYTKTVLPIYGEVSVYLVFEIAGRDKDLDGVTTTIYDILQQSEVIKNDNQITVSEQLKKKGDEDITHIYIKEL